jgi:hypothetical protein
VFELLNETIGVPSLLKDVSVAIPSADWPVESEKFPILKLASSASAGAKDLAPMSTKASAQPTPADVRARALLNLM